MAVQTNAQMQQLTGAYEDLDTDQMITGTIAIPNNHPPVFKMDVNKVDSPVMEGDVGKVTDLIAQSKTTIADMQALIVSKVGINDATASTTQAYSGSKTQGLINEVNTNLESKADQSDVDLKASQLALDIQASRIDNFVAVGSTTDNIETTDIRIGADGITYASAGDSGRKNITKLTDVLNSGEHYEVVPYTVEAGVANLTNGGIAATNFHATLNVLPGEKWMINGSTINANYPFYILMNATTVLGYGSVTAGTYKDQLVTIPNGVTKMIINGTNNFNIYARKLVADNKIKTIENNTNSLLGLVNTTLDYIPLVLTLEANVYHKDFQQVTSATGYHSFVNVIGGDLLKITGRSANASYPFLISYDKNNSIVESVLGTLGTNTDYAYTVPSNVTRICVNNDQGTNIIVKKYQKTTVLDNISKLNKKNIVWFSMSIGAGQYNGVGTSYPEIIAKRLGATVSNESVPESTIHCKKDYRVDALTNPYGFGVDFHNCSRCLSNTIVEMQWCIDNFASDIWEVNKQASLSDADKALILSCSYQNKIDKYLTASTFPSVFAIDHGRNDCFSSTDVSYSADNPYSLYNFRGAMNFIIKHILEYNPKARIIIIGHYTNQSPDIYQAQITTIQTAIALDWELPISKLWEKTGWSQKLITSGGVTKTMMNWWMPDNTHPHSDTSGKATNLIADSATPDVRDL